MFIWLYCSIYHYLEPPHDCHENISSWQGNLSFPLSSADNVNWKNRTTCVWDISVSSGNIIELIITELRVRIHFEKPVSYFLFLVLSSIFCTCINFKFSELFVVHDANNLHIASECLIIFVILWGHKRLKVIKVLSNIKVQIKVIESAFIKNSIHY